MRIIMGNVDGEDNIRSGWELEDKYVDDAASYTTCMHLICFLGNSMRMETVVRQGRFSFRSDSLLFMHEDVLELRGSAFGSP
jgi:hypothetical protein